MAKSCTNGKGWSDYVARLLSEESLAKLEQSAKTHDVGILSIQIEDFYATVGVYGESIGYRLLQEMEEEACGTFERFFGHCEVISTQKNKLNDCLIFFKLPDKAIDELADGAYPYQMNVRKSFNNKVHDLIGKPLDLQVGCARIARELGENFSQNLFKAICEAQRNAVHKPAPERMRLYREFLEILEKHLVATVYQPVLDLRSGRTFGWEALARGPEDSYFHEPAMLFSFAEEIGKVPVLDRLCRQQAVRNAGRLSAEEKLFINVHLQSFYDVSFEPNRLVQSIKATRLHPDNIVLEFSERHVLQDVDLLLESLERLRGEGFLAAVDHVGAGQASLRFISQIRPDYIKIDMSLIRGIDCNPIKRVMVETFLVLADKVGCKVIAEGIETATELSSLTSMGVHFGQGFHVARPSFPKPSVTVSMPARLSINDAVTVDLKCSLPAINLVQKPLQVHPRQTVQEVKTALANRPPMSSVVVVEGRRPVGLLMNYNLDRQLGTLYGISLFYRREVARLMDRNPLIMEAGEPLEQVAKAAMNRDSEKVYDDIIITANGLLLGTISVQTMLDTLAKVQVEMAKGANPLTGLPGNVAIEQEISRRARDKICCSLIYVDLDNFKVYNDAYGFENGDRVILFTAKVIGEAAQKAGKADDFIGHIGGDDFVIIAEQERADDIAAAVVQLFEAGVAQLYSEEDRRLGYIVGKGRDGRECRVPLMSVSIGIVDCAFQSPFTMDELSHRVAEIKKYAKTIPGNAYVRDRRTPIGAVPEQNRRPAATGEHHQQADADALDLAG